MSAVQQTGQFLQAIQKALGLEGLPVQRIVIDADMRQGPVRIYVKGFLPKDADLGIAQAVADLVVSEGANGEPSITVKKAE